MEKETADRLKALVATDDVISDVLQSIVPEGHRCGPIETSKPDWDRMTEALEAREKAAAELMPTEQDAINLMHYAYTRLKGLGWNDPIYCPKDGSSFDVIEAGSTGIFRGHYSGEWPTGHWWIEDGGDISPSRPVLYRTTEAELARREQMRAAFKAHGLARGEQP